MIVGPVPFWRRPAAAAILAVTAPLLLSLPVAATQAPDLVAGQRSYAKCMGCHSPAYNRTGPLHCGVVGRESGSVKDYDYSKAMRDTVFTWDADTLNRFLAAPLQMLPGTSMGFAGIADDAERRDLIAWLATLDETSDLCRDVLLKPNRSK